MKVILPLRAEFGMVVWWHVPAVHAIEGDKVVYCEPGREALYPSASKHIIVEEQEDPKRRNRYNRDKPFVSATGREARRRFPDAEIVYPDVDWPKKRFVPRPWVIQDVQCDVVVCPRRRVYGSEKNWPEWFDLTERLVADGLAVFAGGAADSSYQVRCPRAWDFSRPLDATLEAMHSAKFVVATDAGLSHLAVLTGRPLLLLTHANGRVAPGPVIDETGRHMEDRYWPVKMGRLHEANHTGSSITVLAHAWHNPDLVYREIVRTLRFPEHKNPS